MAANTAPIYTLLPDIQWGNAAAANTAKDGTGTVITAFTADATNGGYVEKIVFRPLAAVVATVVRVFINNGSTNATPANNTLVAEATLAATTNSEVAAIAGIEIPLRYGLPPGYRINFTLGTYSTGSVQGTVIGGKY
jgi:hypothetical protein